MLKKILIHLRTSIKLILLISIATFIIIGAISFCYKPIYSVSINGNFAGYIANKSALQSKINEYMEKGNDDSENIAFAQIENLPEYKLCLLKKNIVTDDDGVFQKIKDESVTYYKYYAILEDNEEKMYVSTFSEAESIIQKLKDKSSSNIDNITVVEKYETAEEDFANEDDAVASLYKENTDTSANTQVAAKQNTKANSKNVSVGKVNTSIKMSSAKVNLPDDLIRPVTGMLTARFGERSSRWSSSIHSGLDIAAPQGTPIKAAASGVVEYAGYKGSYGFLIAINHGDGMETYYGHCSKIYVTAGTTVEQGQTIGAVGATGNATGDHLHLEIRLNGICYNPNDYLY